MLVCGLALALVAPLRAAPVSEYEVKLALTYNLARFVTWPAPREALGELSFCILGNDPFESLLDGIRGRRVRERSVVVVNLDVVTDLGTRCDVVFVSRDEALRVPSVIAAVADAPVLTISDSPGFAAAGGVVELQSRDSRVGFVINQAAYQRADLTISSQLLEIATLVGDAKEKTR
jgi:hypothetical protein